MDEERLNIDQSSDSANAGFFLNGDLLEQILKSLSAVYDKLSASEASKGCGDSALAERYNKRRMEILSLIEGFSIGGKKRRDKAATFYCTELQQVRMLLDQI